MNHKSPVSESVVTDEQRRQYQEDGFAILPGIIPPDMLEMLRAECAAAMGRADQEMLATGKPINDLTHPGKRYFIANRYAESARLWQFLFGDLMADVCRAFLSEEDAWLFVEQWVIKSADVGMKFSWHQDSGYVGYPHRPYLTCWCTLDAVNEQNGTIYVLPHDRENTRDRILPHLREPGSNDLVGYAGKDPGIPIIAPAGSIVAFSSYTLHSSGANRTNTMRRVYLAQYSAEPIYKPGTTIIRNMAVPFLKGGVNVYRRPV